MKMPLMVFGLALLAVGASAAITLGLYLLISRSSRIDALRMALRTSATAVWFAPATILLSAMSPAALAAALVLVVSTTRLLYSQWRWIHPASLARRSFRKSACSSSRRHRRSVSAI